MCEIRSLNLKPKCQRKIQIANQLNASSWILVQKIMKHEQWRKLGSWHGGGISLLIHVLYQVSDVYVYKLAPNVTIRGLHFRTRRWQTKRPSHYLDIDDYDLRNFTFVTGASSNHFRESKDLIASIQNVFPDKNIYYYDLGLKQAQIKEVKHIY